jgi:hypothetical protein
MNQNDFGKFHFRKFHPQFDGDFGDNVLCRSSWAKVCRSVYRILRPLVRMGEVAADSLEFEALRSTSDDYFDAVEPGGSRTPAAALTTQLAHD